MPQGGWIGEPTKCRVGERARCDMGEIWSINHSCSREKTAGCNCMIKGKFGENERPKIAVPKYVVGLSLVDTPFDARDVSV